jgi:hypothetical protein
MKKILFIGDSHLARLELAHKTRSNKQDYTAVFFCTPGPINNLIDISGGKLGLIENNDLLRNHPQAGKFDFVKWFSDAQEKLDEISRNHSLSCSHYSDIVIVSYQFFNPEIWANTSISYERGHISHQLLSEHLVENYSLNHAKTHSNHYKLLKQLSQAQVKSKIYSATTPARSEAADFPGNLLKEGETLGKRAFRTAEHLYSEIIREKFGSTLLPYPEELLAANGLCTSIKFQNADNDYTHINLDGSKIWLDCIIRQIISTNSHHI